MEYSFVSLGPALRIITLVALFGFALIALALVIALAALPGRIARKRGHPQADAITICGWVGLPTGFFWIAALVWAYVKPPADQADPALTAALSDHIARLEDAVTVLEKQH